MRKHHEPGLDPTFKLLVETFRLLEDIHRHVVQLNHKVERLMATQAEVAQELRDLKVQNEKDRQENAAFIAELRARIAALEEAVNNQANASDELVAAKDELKASLAARDADVEPGQV